MPRGRKKDLTIPPTRSLVQQRDYRARRAHYVANLEERCRRAEEENTHLRQELDEVRGRLVNPVLLLPETAAASSELMQRLSSAKEALVKFNRLIFPNAIGSTGSIETMQSHAPAYRPGPSIQSTFSSPSPQSRNDTNNIRRKELYVDNSLPPYVSQPPSDQIIPLVSESDVNEECCGGLINCSEFCEDEDSNVLLSRTSEIRSTTNID